jgi:mRNA interferase MazF
MKEYSFGEIVLMSFPFSDSLSTKRRPALILLDTGDDDIIVTRVTSQLAQAAFDVEIIDWRQAGLLLPSVARIDKISTLEKNLVEKRLGSLVSKDCMKVLKCIENLYNLIIGKQLGL